MRRNLSIALLAVLALACWSAPAAGEEERMSRGELFQALELILADLAGVEDLSGTPTKVRHYADGSFTVSTPLTPELIERISIEGTTPAKSAPNLVTLMNGLVRGNADTSNFDALPSSSVTSLGTNYFAWIAVANFGSAGKKKATATIKGPGSNMKRTGNPRWAAQSLVFVFLGNAMRFQDGGVWQNTSKVKTGGNVKYKFIAQ